MCPSALFGDAPKPQNNSTAPPPTRAGTQSQQERQRMAAAQRGSIESTIITGDIGTLDLPGQTRRVRVGGR